MERFQVDVALIVAVAVLKGQRRRCFVLRFLNFLSAKISILSHADLGELTVELGPATVTLIRCTAQFNGLQFTQQTRGAQLFALRFTL